MAVAEDTDRPWSRIGTGQASIRARPGISASRKVVRRIEIVIVMSICAQMRICSISSDILALRT